MTLTIPVSPAAQNMLNELAVRSGESPAVIPERAVEDYRRKVFFEAMNAGYAALRSDPAAWSEELAQRHTWDATMGDGLADVALEVSAGITRRGVKSGSWIA